MKQVTRATAARIHYAFRGRLVGLLVLTHCGVPPMPFLPQESPCIRVAGIAFVNNKIFSVNSFTSPGEWRAVTPRKYKPIFFVRCNAAEVFLVLREQHVSEDPGEWFSRGG